MTDKPQEGARELIEKLAALEHARWSRWHLYALPNWTEANKERWWKQAHTLYSELSEREKDSDRQEVMKYWPLIEPLLRKAELADGLAKALACVHCGEENKYQYDKHGDEDDCGICELLADYRKITEERG